MADNIAVLDGAGASKTVRTTDTAGVHTPHHNVSLLDALSALIDTITAKLATDAIMNGTTALTPKFDESAVPAGA